jgi:hypothetical protein
MPISLAEKNPATPSFDASPRSTLALFTSEALWDPLLTKPVKVAYFIFREDDCRYLVSHFPLLFRVYHGIVLFKSLNVTNYYSEEEARTDFALN